MALILPHMRIPLAHKSTGILTSILDTLRVLSHVVFYWYIRSYIVLVCHRLSMCVFHVITIDICLWPSLVSLVVIWLWELHSSKLHSYWTQFVHMLCLSLSLLWELQVPSNLYQNTAGGKIGNPPDLRSCIYNDPANPCDYMEEWVPVFNNKNCF